MQNSNTKLSFSIKMGNKSHEMIEMCCSVYDKKLLFSWQNAGDYAGLRKQGGGLHFLWSSD